MSKADKAAKDAQARLKWLCEQTGCPAMGVVVVKTDSGMKVISTINEAGLTEDDPENINVVANMMAAMLGTVQANIQSFSRVSEMSAVELGNLMSVSMDITKVIQSKHEAQGEEE